MYWSVRVCIGRLVSVLVGSFFGVLNWSVRESVVSSCELVGSSSELVGSSCELVGSRKRLGVRRIKNTIMRLGWFS